jgi:hypothetical protein
MKGILQAATFFYFGVAVLHAADPQKSFTWDPPKVPQSMFTKDIGMLDSERDEYATNLAIYASNMITTTKASAQSLAEARRVMGLALHLSPRNKRTIVTSFQLSKGLLPEAVQTNYSPQVLARLLLTRGQLLEKQGGDENKKLARFFIHLAATMDPKNDDAVYASEVQRLDHGDVDWAAVTNGVPKPATSPAPGPSQE